MMVDATAAKAARGLDTTVTRVTGTAFSALLTGGVAVSGLKYDAGAAGVAKADGEVLGSIVTGGAGDAASTGVGSDLLIILAMTRVLEAAGVSGGAGVDCAPDLDAGALLDGFSLGDAFCDS